MKKLLATILLVLSVKGEMIAQTFNDVAPILVGKCGVCHKPGEAAPFSLLQYEDFAKRISFIKQVIETSYMPPWQADPHYSSFSNDRSLTRQEKELVLKWIDAKAPKGKKSKIKTRSIVATQPVSRTPDLVLKTSYSFMVKGDNKEKFIQFKVPFELVEEKNVERIEFVTNNKKLVHHINYGIYSVPDTNMDIRSTPSVIDTDNEIGKRVAFDPFKKQMVYYTGWVPGSSGEHYPRSFGWVLPKRGVVIFTVHYSAIAASEASDIGINLFFKEEKVERPIRVVSIGSGGIGEKDIQPAFIIPPGKESVFELKLRTPENQSLLYAWPHMHYLGKQFVAFVVTPKLDTINLVKIDNWDFRWQEMYRFKRFIKIPAGSIIHMKGVYDNTANNPFNPSKPPKIVTSTGSMKSDDEMFTLLLIYSKYKEGDELLEINKDM